MYGTSFEAERKGRPGAARCGGVISTNAGKAAVLAMRHVSTRRAAESSHASTAMDALVIDVCYSEGTETYDASVDLITSSVIDKYLRKDELTVRAT